MNVLKLTRALITKWDILANPHFAFSIEQQLSLETLQEIGRLRVQAWGAKNLSTDGLAGDVWMDMIDCRPSTQHFICRFRGEIIAASRMSYHQDVASAPCADWGAQHVAKVEGEVGMFGRLVVSPKFQGMGLGSLITETRILIAKAKGIKNIVVIARGSKIRDWFSDLGFMNHGIAPKRPGQIVDPQSFYVMSADVDGCLRQLRQSVSRSA